MKRWLLLFGGILLVLVGLAVSALGAGTLALFNPSDSVSTPVASAKGVGAALLIEHIRVDASSIPLPHNLGTLQLSATSPNGASVFLGAASPDNVDTYLTGAPYDVVVDLTTGGKVTTRPVPGTQTPAPPTSQHFWTEQANGQSPSISALVGSNATVVVMNSDASSGVAADLVVSLQLPGARKAGWIAVGSGLLLVLLGALAMWRSVVAKRVSQATLGAHAAGHEHLHEHDVAHHHHAVGDAVVPDAEPPVAEPPATEPPATEPPVAEPPATEPPVAEPPANAAEADAQVEPRDPALVPPWVFVEGADPVEVKPYDGTGPSSDSA